ncbi:TPA: hypothetical protein N0F65_004900, partial [Lagenidium giganteum]
RHRPWSPPMASFRRNSKDANLSHRWRIELNAVLKSPIMATPPPTQKTPEAAATAIQARYRGHRHRKQHHRAVRGVTKLQARQRGRATRREFQQLLAFHTQHAGFLEATKQRQRRIWAHEQELYFLRHTTSEQYDAVRQFQKKRSARVIQRGWKQRTIRQTPRTQARRAARQREPFDPFGFVGAAAAYHAASSESWTKRDTLQSLAASPTIPPPQLPAVIATAEGFAERRKRIQERIQERSKEMTKHERIQSPNKAREKMSSREKRQLLYQQLIRERQQTINKLAAYDDQWRETRDTRQYDIATILASCDARLQRLRERSDTTTAGGEPILRAAKAESSSMQAWPAKRQASAWMEHKSALDGARHNGKWWSTVIAAKQQDIRQVSACSPWDTDKMVWKWPHEENRAFSEAASSGARQKSAISDALMATSLPDPDDHSHDGKENHTACRQLLDDTVASSWWRAHCTQSHLVSSATDNNSTDDGARKTITPEMVANTKLYAQYLLVQERRRHIEIEKHVKAANRKTLSETNKLVYEIDTQVDVNTKLQQQVLVRRQQRKAQKSREEQAATHIQRCVRGASGRQRAKEVRAQYFVMVRGRAIRRGMCEECGEQRAVLECGECEEGIHFCPSCWVSVHSTRRRKAHTPLPMVLLPLTHATEEPKKIQLAIGGSNVVPKTTAPSLTRQDVPSTTMQPIRMIDSLPLTVNNKKTALKDGQGESLPTTELKQPQPNIYRLSPHRLSKITLESKATPRAETQLVKLVP